MTGLLLHQAHDITMAIAEILNNAIEHGGGHGEITMTDVDDQLHCRIDDEGTGLREDPYFYRGNHPDATALRGRGLWMVFTLCPTATVDSSRYGTRVVLTAELPKRRVL
jgi:anti-sigma regulatory factor (Ser/Thr protein kinase)